jgi:hypothetical protein
MQEATEATHVTELRRSDAPDEVVRLGPTVTVVMGFGRTVDVVAWLSDALAAAPHQVLNAESLDAPYTDPEARRAEIDTELDELEMRADVIEAELAQIRADADDAERRAVEALAIAVEWERYKARVAAAAAAARPATVDTGAPSPPGGLDAVVHAHLEVERLRSLLAAASRSERRELAQRFDAARAAEDVALRAEGCTSYAEYLTTRSVRPARNLSTPPARPAASPDEPDAATAAAAARQLEETADALRAKAADVLGHEPGGDPAVELRELVGALTGGSQARSQLERELADIDERGNTLADERAALENGVVRPTAAEVIGPGHEPLLVDGLLFDAVTTDVYEDLLIALIDAAPHRQVVVVSDDPAIERWGIAVPAGAVWTNADSHRLRGASSPPPIAAWDARFEAEMGARRLGAKESTPALLVCSNHPGAVTRLTCTSCERPFCDVCLMVLERDKRVVCVQCALNRAGVRKRRRR